MSPVGSSSGSVDCRIVNSHFTSNDTSLSSRQFSLQIEESFKMTSDEKREQYQLQDY